ncbi:hypothetical protein ABPG75_008804 [Micractinium tetrahymenae]
MEEEAPPAAGAAAAVAVAAAAGEAQMAEADAAPAVPEAAAAAAAATGAPPAGSAQRTGGLQQPLLEMAGCRWLDGDAAYAGLTAPKDAGLSLCKEPQLQPQAGSLLLFDQDRCPEYRRDGYEWRKGKVKYTLKVNGVDTVSCFYDKPEDQRPDALQRRRYVLRDPGQGPRQAVGDAFERLDSSGLEHFIWWTHLDECVALDGGESAVQAFAQMVADQPEPVAAAG